MSVGCPRYRTPAPAIIAQAAWSSLLVLSAKADALVNYTTWHERIRVDSNTQANAAEATVCPGDERLPWIIAVQARYS
jgi:hypothetical protein